MSLHAFTQLTEDDQLYAVFATGIFVATRGAIGWEANLYVLPGAFFVEVHYNTAHNVITHLMAFEAGDENDRLPDYAMFVKLPD
jgi:hypothetical protein